VRASTGWRCVPHWQAGDITVSASCPGLRTGSVTISSHPFPLADGYSRMMPVMPVTPLPATAPDWSSLARATPPMTVTPAPPNAGAAGHFTEAFNYTGPTGLVHVESNAANAKNAYCDSDYAFTNLPGILTGADWVQTAEADCRYSAADLMQIAVRAGTTVYVAHDNELPRPGWLRRQFHPTTVTFDLNGRTMKVFECWLQSDGSLTLGSNTDDAPPKSCNMYLVFVKRDASASLSSASN
jgi:hypothetical protein